MHRSQDVNALLHEMTALKSDANFTFVKLRKVPKLKRNGNEQMTQFPEMSGGGLKFSLQPALWLNKRKFEEALSGKGQVQFATFSVITHSTHHFYLEKTELIFLHVSYASPFLRL